MLKNAMDGSNGTCEYAAFICCRQTEPAKKAAELIQKRIESYIIPKELRSDPAVKDLGMVYRDKNDFPMSSALSDEITFALDHSRYMIVICSPDLPDSKWCEAEIRYFGQKHGSNHILAVLADGRPDESFPPMLLNVYDDEGNIIGRDEPLAVNLADNNHGINTKAFNRESARILAMLLNRPFNEVWEIERKGTTRLMSAVSSLFQKKKTNITSSSTPAANNVLSFSFSRPNQTIRFFREDLTDTDQAYDVIVCSTYKGMYEPALYSLIGALETKKNISVKELAKDPELDMRELGGWLSRPINKQFKQLLCVELTAYLSSDTDTTEEADITPTLKSAFLTLRNLLERASVQGKDIRRIALPILGAGYQQIDIEYIAPPLFVQCVNMLKTIPTLETIDFYEIDPEKYQRLVAVCNELADSATEKAPDLFISYSTAQTEYAHKIQTGLKENGISAWIAPESIPTGSSYISEIPRAIASVRAILLVLTKEAQNSRWVQKEVGSAIGAGKLLLPMIIDSFTLTPEMSFLLEGEQFYPIYQEDEEQQIPAIIEEVQTRLNA